MATTTYNSIYDYAAANPKSATESLGAYEARIASEYKAATAAPAAATTPAVTTTTPAVTTTTPAAAAVTPTTSTPAAATITPTTSTPVTTITPTTTGATLNINGVTVPATADAIAAELAKAGMPAEMIPSTVSSMLAGSSASTSTSTGTAAAATPTTATIQLYGETVPATIEGVSAVLAKMGIPTENIPAVAIQVLDQSGYPVTGTTNSSSALNYLSSASTPTTTQYTDLITQYLNAILADSQTAYQDPYADQITSALNALTNIANTTYQNPYADQISSALNALTNFDSSYDVYSDPQYEALKEYYERAGRDAYADQMATLAAMTGGRPSTAATAAASQAQNVYNQNFASSVLPALIAQGQQQKQQEYTNIISQLQALQGVSNDEYAQYRDDTADYSTLLNALTNASNTEYTRDTVQDSKLYDVMSLLQGLDTTQYERAYQALRDAITDTGTLPDGSKTLTGQLTDAELAQSAANLETTQQEQTLNGLKIASAEQEALANEAAVQAQAHYSDIQAYINTLDADDPLIPYLQAARQQKIDAQAAAEAAAAKLADEAYQTMFENALNTFKTTGVVTDWMEPYLGLPAGTYSQSYAQAIADNEREWYQAETSRLNAETARINAAKNSDSVTFKTGSGSNLVSGTGTYAALSQQLGMSAKELAKEFGSDIEYVLQVLDLALEADSTNSTEQLAKYGEILEYRLSGGGGGLTSEGVKLIEYLLSQ